MSYTTSLSVTLRCDAPDCFRQFTSYQYSRISAGRARQEAQRKEGWTYRRKDDADLCPRHKGTRSGSRSTARSTP